MNTIDISKGWLPDFLPFNVPAGGLLECKNLLPLDEYYAPAQDKLIHSSNAVTGVPLYGQEFKSSGGVFYTFIGTSTKLWRLELNKSLSDISKISTTYTGSLWNMCQYGDWIIATNYTEAPQVLKVLTTAHFIDLGGTPPKAKYCLFNSGHLILGNTFGTFAEPKKLTWSAHENVEDFAQSLTTGADSQTLADAQGDITGMANVGSMFCIFHENSITLGWYSGAPFTFSFLTNKVNNVGAIPGTVISIGNIVFFWDERDIYAFDGTSVQSIGFGVKRTILQNLNWQYLNRITNGYDSKNGLVYWAYPTTASVDGTPDRMLVYNVRSKKFSHVDIPIGCLFAVRSGAVDMDSLDAIYPSIDTLPFNIDSNIWFDNTPTISCIDPLTLKVGKLVGLNLPGTIETPETYTMNVSMIDKVKPMIQLATGAVNVSVGTRMKENDDVVYTLPSPVGSNGYADVRASGNFIRVKVETADHSGLTAINVNVQEVSGR